MNVSELGGKVTAFVAAEAMLRIDRISPGASLRQLGIDGDDARELMAKFGKQFDVDLGGFRFEDYFDDEGFNPLCLFSTAWWRRKRLSLTVGNLIEAAERGCWRRQDG